MQRVLVLGGVSYNMMIYVPAFPQPRAQTIFSHGYHETVGSSGAGKALNLHKLGLNVTLYALIGDDAAGEQAQTFFRQQGVRFCAGLDPGGTRRHVNLMDEAGERISIFIADGTFEPPLDLDEVDGLVAARDHVVLNITNYCRHFIPLIRAHHKPLWCDIHDYDGQNPYHHAFINAADYIFMSSANMPAYRDFMQRLIAQGKQLVVCTHGKQGATALTATGEWVETAAMPGTSLVDTNGAGDAFFAGTYYGIAHGHTLQHSLRLGAAAAGMCVTSPELAAPDLTPATLEATSRHWSPAT